MNSTVNDAVRMVGQLLLHNSTTDAHVRDHDGSPVCLDDKTACQFCYIGAVRSVRGVLLPNNGSSILRRACERALNLSMFEAGPTWWDSATDKQRTVWAQQMADWKEP